ncbi:matrix-remodeling-associated protein 5 [Microcaecilia unicolor]|uniref:Matrix-remodeling-associated protein 5 n=1 Tax=Microcaecilia unicolor TaxID=1415580 RepID=A0A6P7Y5B1_9AMPH|nr:matrix-remodeling-associated protein 5 [Microcaecilia unicolor]
MKKCNRTQQWANVWSLSVVLILCLGVVHTTLACPHPCACYVPTEVHCTFRSLVAVPERIQKHVERINLGFNSIRSIAEDSFSDLTRLEMLMMHGNDIHDIPDGAFRDLASLQVFKMSYNKLKMITSQTFLGLSGLVRLHIDHNKIEFIHPTAFHGLTSLRLLHLEGNLLQQLHPNTFATFVFLDYFRLSTLKHLSLSENVIKTLPAGMVQSMPVLESLYLHGNPWSCDCSMKWLLQENRKPEGVLKCKKDRAYEGGQLCPTCSSPRHLYKQEIQSLSDVSCTKPIIQSAFKQNSSATQMEGENEPESAEALQTVQGKISLNMTDEHGNIVNISCNISQLADSLQVQWNQILPEEIDINATLSLDFECPMSRENYEKLWKLLAYYSEVPVHLQRELMQHKDSKVSYQYKQDPNPNAYYYTGVKAQILAEPAWLMQQLITIRLNRQQSTAQQVALSFLAQFSQTIQTKDTAYQRNSWVMIERNEKIKVAQSVVEGTVCQLSCNVKASDNASIEWVFPDESRLQAPSNSHDSRFSVSSSGQLLIRAAEYSDSGVYHCIAKVKQEMDRVAFRVSVQPPVIQSSDGDIQIIKINSGESIVLPCNAVAAPDAQINWILPNNYLLNDLLNTTREYMLENGTLLIQNSQVSDNGYYRCVAINQKGTDLSVFQVTVNNRKVTRKQSKKIKIKTRPVIKSSANIKQDVIEDEGASGDEEIRDVPSQYDQQRDREVSVNQRLDRLSTTKGKKKKKDRKKKKMLKELQKSHGSNVAEGRRKFESRRRINTGNKQIDPQHWANILAKVRGKNVYKTTVEPFLLLTKTSIEESQREDPITPLPTVMPPFKPTADSQENIEESSADGLVDEDEIFHVTTLDSVTLMDYKEVRTSTEPKLIIDNSKKINKLLERPGELLTSQIPFLWTTSSTVAPLIAPNQQHDDGIDYSPIAKENIHSFSQQSEYEGTTETTETYAFENPSITYEPWVSLDATAQEKDYHTVINNHAESRTNAQPNGMNTQTTSFIPSQANFMNSVDFGIAHDTTSVTSLVENEAMHRLPKVLTEERVNENNVNENTSILVNRDTNEGPQATTEIDILGNNSTVLSHGHFKGIEYLTTPVSEADSTFKQPRTIIPLEREEMTTAASLDRLMTPVMPTTPYIETTSSSVTARPRRRPHGKKRLRPNRLRQRQKHARPTASLTVLTHKILTPTSASETRNVIESSLVTSMSENNKPSISVQPEKVIHMKTITVPVTDSRSLWMSTEDKQKGITSLWSSTVASPGKASATLATTAESMLLLRTEQIITTEALGENIIKENTLLPGKEQLSPTSDLKPTSTILHILHAAEKSFTQVNFEDNSYKSSTISGEKSSSFIATSHPDHKATTESFSTFRDHPLVIDSLERAHHISSTIPPPISPVVLQPSKPGIALETKKMLPFTEQPQLTKTETPKMFSVIRSETEKLISTPAHPQSHTQLVVGEKMGNSYKKFEPHYTARYGLSKEPVSTITPITFAPIENAETDASLGFPSTDTFSFHGSSVKEAREHMDLNQVEAKKSKTEAISQGTHFGSRQNELATSYFNKNKIQTQPTQEHIKDTYSRKSNSSVLLTPKIHHQPGIIPGLNQRPVVAPPQFIPVRSTLKPPHFITHAPWRYFITHPPLHFTNRPEITAYAVHSTQARKTHTPHSVRTTTTATVSPLYKPNPIIPSWFNHQGPGRVTINSRIFGNHYVIDNRSTIGRTPHQGIPYYSNSRLPFVFNRTRGIPRLGVTSKPLIPTHSASVIATEKKVVLGSSIKEATSSSVLRTTTTPKSIMTHLITTPIHLAKGTVPKLSPTIFPHRNGDHNNQRFPSVSKDGEQKLNNPTATQLAPSFQTLREGPIIITPRYQTLSIPAEMDAVFPCDAIGEPKPFLTWTKVSTGALMTVNTRIPRFEVFKNGSFIIRKVQLQDRGQYLCTAQNPYGVDKMLITLTVVAQQPKIVASHYKDVTVYLGETMKLECQASGIPAPHISWIFPDKKVMQTSSTVDSRIIISENGTLIIKETTFSDRGVFKCIASNVAGADSLIIRLHIAALPPIIQQEKQENISLSPGHSVYIHCTIKAAPMPSIRWILFDGTQIRPSQFVNGNMFVFPNGTLYIRNVLPRDSGRYECVAVNIVGNAKRTVHIDVKKPSSNAKITASSPQKTDVTYGSTLHLDCSAAGDPWPRILWRLPSKRLVDSLYSFESRIKVYINGTLIIHSVTDKDAGDYLCVARNKIGDDHVVLKVNVMMKPAKIEHKNEVHHKVFYGSDLKVDCVATGLPNPEISWSLPDGSMINTLMQSDDSGTRTRRYVVFDNGTLYFNEVGMREEGDYTCYAVNQIGQDEMRVSVKVVAEPAVIRNKEYSVINVPYGNVITIACEVKGEPTPKVTWFSPTNRPLSSLSDKYEVYKDGTLRILKAQRSDSGNYTCLARNSAGEAKKIVQIQVNVQPPKINGHPNTVTTIKETAMINSRKLINCKAEGIPTPRVLWAFPEGVILPAPYYGNRITVHRNGTLEINTLKKTDSVQLVCIGRNEGGEARLIVQLTVMEHMEKPIFRNTFSEKISIAAGHTISLNCSAEGNPEPEIVWILPNGTQIESGHHFHRIYHSNNGTLYIRSLSVAESGTYRCTARNRAGYIERQISLKVGFKPEISNLYNNLVNIINGETLQLQCTTQGSPRPHVSWTLPNGMVLDSPQTSGRISLFENGSLIIRDASVYDRGTYLCKVSTQYGSSVMNVPVIVIAYPPRITNGPAPVIYTRAGNTVQLNCMTIGIPRAEVTWELPDKSHMVAAAQSHLYGNKFLHPQGTLVIQHPSQRDAGLYKCTAKNILGSDSKSTYIHVL